MKLRKIFPLLALLMTLWACDENRNAEAETELATADLEIQDPEESMDQWEEAWNRNNAEELKGLMADDAVVVIFGESMQDEQADSWIDSTASWMKNLRSTPIIKNKGETMAYEVGDFTHGTKENDTVQMEGTYTVIWERSADQNEWRVKLMNVSPKMAQDSLQLASN